MHQFVCVCVCVHVRITVSLLQPLNERYEQQQVMSSAVQVLMHLNIMYVCYIPYV